MNNDVYLDKHEDPEIGYICETVNLGGDLGECRLGMYTHTSKEHCNDEPYFFLENKNGIQTYIDLRDNRYYKNCTMLTKEQCEIFNDFIKNGYSGDLNWSIWNKLSCYWKGYNIDSDYYESLEGISQPDYSTIKNV